MLPSLLFTTLRRISGPAIALLLLGTGAYPAFSQTYYPNPSSVAASITLAGSGNEEQGGESGTNTSSPTAGLPSVSAGGTATVSFTFESGYSAYEGGGAAEVQYLSDDQTTWISIAAQSANTTESYSRPVNVSNLSTLQFRMLASGQVSYSGNASISGIASDLSVSVAPANSVVFSNLQNTQEWKLCEGECVINGTNTGPPDNNGYIYYGISSPSLSGASMEQEDNSINYPYFDVLYSLDEANELDQGLTLGCSTAPCPLNHFIDDVWFYIPQSSLGSIEALEFDPDYSDPNKNTYKMSMECTSAYDNPANHWQYWNSSTNTWVDTGQDCSSVWSNHDKWQHLTIQTAVNSTSNTYTYQAVLIGVQGSQQQNVTWTGMTTNQISPGSTPQGWPMNVWVQQEIDNTSAGGASIVYYDDYTLTAWQQ